MTPKKKNVRIGNFHEIQSCINQFSFLTPLILFQSEFRIKIYDHFSPTRSMLTTYTNISNNAFD
jgi:hypothetical protein